MALQAVAQDEIPVLGVCLGFHGIAHVHGCRIEHAPAPVHGRTSAIHHSGTGLFAGIPTPFNAVRYHSLIVAPPLGRDVVATAHSDCGVVMALEHRSLPKCGVQFHPESILTEHGLRLIANFRDLAHRTVQRQSVRVSTPSRNEAIGSTATKTLQVLVREIDVSAGADALFTMLFAGQEHCFWLDSQLTIDGMAEFSFMGAAAAGAVLEYHLASDASGIVGQEKLRELERELASVVLEGAKHCHLPSEAGSSAISAMRRRRCSAASAGS
ncbi:MAG: aminodeoxychorismate/anthranilate synthase component II [Gammaproteobacteria bacterium]|nr:aminodeoxychorismate/anthranilate synthase component II [Gammaproteobacteria bacterium]